MGTDNSKPPHRWYDRDSEMVFEYLILFVMVILFFVILLVSFILFFDVNLSDHFFKIFTNVLILLFKSTLLALVISITTGGILGFLLREIVDYHRKKHGGYYDWNGEVYLRYDDRLNINLEKEELKSEPVFGTPSIGFLTITNFIFIWFTVFMGKTFAEGGWTASEILFQTILSFVTIFIILGSFKSARNRKDEKEESEVKIKHKIMLDQFIPFKGKYSPGAFSLFLILGGVVALGFMYLHDSAISEEEISKYFVAGCVVAGAIYFPLEVIIRIAVKDVVKFRDIIFDLILFIGWLIFSVYLFS